MAKIPQRKNISAQTAAKRIEEVEELKNNIDESIRENSANVVEISIATILPPKFHDRRWHDKLAIIELAKSIEAVGLIYPIVLRKVGEDFERVIGYRRMEAFKYLGKETIPAIILENISDETAILLMATENMQREDISVYDETLALIDYLKVAMNEPEEIIEKLLVRFKNHDAGTIQITDEEKDKRVQMNDILKKTGKIDISGLLNRLSMLSMHPLIKAELSASRLSFSNAQAIQKISKNEDILRIVLERVIAENMSKRETIKLVAEYVDKTKNKAGEGSLQEIVKIIAKSLNKKRMKTLSSSDHEKIAELLKKVEEIIFL